MQVEYFRQLGIRNVELARADLDDSVVCNLQQLSYWDSRPVEMGAREEEQLVLEFLRALAGGIPPIEVMREGERDRGLDLEDCRRVFYRAIWRRVLRVDLFKPVVVDRPMRPERRDVLDVYADLFKRS